MHLVLRTQICFCEFFLIALPGTIESPVSSVPITVSTLGCIILHIVLNSRQDSCLSSPSFTMTEMRNHQLAFFSRLLREFFFMQMCFVKQLSKLRIIVQVDAKACHNGRLNDSS